MASSLEFDMFPLVVALPVQWGDQDAFGHVNNTVLIRWFESARIAYLEQSHLLPQLEREKLGPILAAVNCNYRRQINYPDTVRIGACITRTGQSSFTMVHQVWSEAQQAVAAEGESAVVIFDYAAQRPVRMSDAIRALITRFENGRV